MIETSEIYRKCSKNILNSRFKDYINSNGDLNQVWHKLTTVSMSGCVCVYGEGSSLDVSASGEK